MMTTIPGARDDLTPPRAAYDEQLAALRREVASLRRAPRRERRAAPARRVGVVALVGLLMGLLPLGLLAAGPFTDLNPGSVHNPNIEAIAAAGITKGCDPGVAYCPSANVTREEMASFLARTAGLGGNPPVANALTAVSAQSATTAQNATSATNATNATNAAHAATADTATNAPNAQPKYARTIVVGPVGDAAANGAALRAALDGITAATAENPFLLKVEPGTYALTGTGLQMKPFVGIEGSGKSATIIQGLPGMSGPTVLGATGTELRQLSIVAVSLPNAAPLPLVISGEGVAMWISDVTLRSSGSAGSNVGLLINQGASAIITGTTIQVIGPGRVLSLSGGTATIDSSRLDGGASGDAMVINGGTVAVSNSLIGGAVGIASGATVKCFGTYRANYTPTSGSCQ